MANKNEPYIELIVESFEPSSTAGLHGKIHIRPITGQGIYTPHMHVECSKVLIDTKLYPVGTKFKIRAKITNREGGKSFLYSHYSWPYEVIKEI
jgi:hypothetical protein